MKERKRGINAKKERREHEEREQVLISWST